LAAELGCSEQTRRNWLRQDEADRGERADVLSSQERKRLRELERENRVLRQELPRPIDRRRPKRRAGHDQRRLTELLVEVS
jgi:transposase-like protein